jgi:hypothetical protein
MAGSVAGRVATQMVSADPPSPPTGSAAPPRMAMGTAHMDGVTLGVADTVHRFGNNVELVLKARISMQGP